ncbi:MAG: hypothetical protein HOC91_02060 [Nitrospinaceae bacterium]|jgi:hypothetical protein|nr:hypothetical protein [Nitrospinaceae bacterium]MBT3435354.1 hypothetical protein [Nitrospinaceae bacterium]MBT3821407.1 hypothetical protein [Nitrospinaceae bacterium]MBT4429278.1 hypothetical protein [Nitrospinaceae bacterium]MBT5367553.1 hypothetical protein [Nitrospinaceae bacterium]
MLNYPESPRTEVSSNHPSLRQPSLLGLSHIHRQRSSWIAGEEKQPSQDPDKKENNDGDKTGEAPPKLPQWMHSLIRSMKFKEEEKKKPRG